MAQNWGLVIGINKYKNLRSLDYAQRDAELVRDFFLHGLGFARVDYFAENAPPIESKNGSPISAEPTFEDLDNFLDRRFSKPFLGAGDTFWFFFAGHGKRFKERDYLLPSGVNPNNPDRAGLAVSYIVEKLQNSGAGNIILLIDACRNDSSRDGLGIGGEIHQGVIRLFSCAPNQISYKIDELKHGAFTYALLQGLRIQGENNCATVGRLAEHIKVQVPYLVERYKGQKQHPILGIEPDSKKDLIILPRQATPDDVAKLRLAAYDAEHDGDLDLAEEYWIRVFAVSSDRKALEAIKRLDRQKLGYGSPPSIPPVDSGKGRAAVEPPVISNPVMQVGAQGLRPEVLAAYSEDLGNGINLEMVCISGGTFQMGSTESSSEQPVHEVTIQPFYLGKYPITQEQYQAVMGSNPSYFKDKGEKRPVENVSWDDAVKFCEKLSQNDKKYRLPSEAEWEYACRAGTQTKYYFGDDESKLKDYAWYRENSGDTTHPVGEKKPNAFGLYDMHGNVGEWCSDRWHANYNNAPTDGSSWETGTVNNYALRGGSWDYGVIKCRSANRNRLNAYGRNDFTSFRLVVA